MNQAASSSRSLLVPDRPGKHGSRTKVAGGGEISSRASPEGGGPPRPVDPRPAAERGDFVAASRCLLLVVDQAAGRRTSSGARPQVIADMPSLQKRMFRSRSGSSGGPSGRRTRIQAFLEARGREVPRHGSRRDQTCQPGRGECRMPKPPGQPAVEGDSRPLPSLRREQSQRPSLLSRLRSISTKRSPPPA